MTILYQLEPDLAVDEFIDVLSRTSLGARRPLARRDVCEAMLRNADLVLTARRNAEERRGLLVGISRAITDFSYCTYLSDLAVDENQQGEGIGRELIQRTHQAAGLHTMLILIAAPDAETYYPHIGMTQHPSCWYVSRGPWPENFAGRSK